MEVSSEAYRSSTYLMLKAAKSPKEKMEAFLQVELLMTSSRIVLSAAVSFVSILFVKSQ